MVYETKVDWEYEQKCTTSYEKECHGYGYHQECEDVSINSKPCPCWDTINGLPQSLSEALIAKILFTSRSLLIVIWQFFIIYIQVKKVYFDAYFRLV